MILKSLSSSSSMPHSTAVAFSICMVLASCDGKEGPVKTETVAVEHDLGQAAGQDAPNPTRPGADLATDDLAYLLQLRLIEAELRAALELYRLHDPQSALLHLKKNGASLYEDIRPALLARGADGFETSIQRLAAAIEVKHPFPEVQSMFLTSLAQIDAASGAVSSATRNSFAPLFFLVAALVQRAGDEAAEATGSIDGIDLTHYRSSWALTETAAQLLLRVPPERRTGIEQAFDMVEKELAVLASDWSELTGPIQGPRSEVRFRSAARRIEQVAATLE